jgi:hypothetical protein
MLGGRETVHSSYEQLPRRLRRARRDLGVALHEAIVEYAQARADVPVP